MSIVMISSIVMGILRLDSDPFRQSLFENFTKNYRNTTEFCAIFSLFNIYTFTLAYLYSPAKNASNDNDYRDNPTFSMLNNQENSDDDQEEEEEDIVYGYIIKFNS
jgi:hypothetical protein